MPFLGEPLRMVAAEKIARDSVLYRSPLLTEETVDGDAPRSRLGTGAAGLGLDRPFVACKREGALLIHRCGVQERGGGAQSQIITTTSNELSAEPQDRIAIVVGRTRGRWAREESAVSPGLELILAPPPSKRRHAGGERARSRGRGH